MRARGIAAVKIKSDETAWVASASAGDQEACALLFRRHAPRLLKALRASFELSHEEMEDVIQETFVHAFANLTRLRVVERFGTWILVIGRREALLHLTAGRRKAAYDAQYWHEVDWLVEPPAEVEADVATSIVRELVAALPEGPEKETVTSFYFEGGQSADELAKKLGVAKGTVTSRLTRFRGRVKRRLAAILNRVHHGEVT